MSGPSTSTSSAIASSEGRIPRALADIQLNTLLAADHGTSSDDEPPNVPTEDAQTAIGISIGEQQTRLTSPKTPAVEKAAAIDEAGGFFGGGIAEEQQDELDEETAEVETEAGAGAEDGQDHHFSGTEGDAGDGAPFTGEIDLHTSPMRSPRRTHVRLPSPWRAPSKSRRPKSSLMDGLPFNKKRATSGPDSTLESWQKAFMSNLPSMPKHFSLSSPFSSILESSHHEPSESMPRSKRASFTWSGMDGSGEQRTQRQLARHRSESDSRANALSPSISLRDQEEANATLGDLPSRPQLQKARSRQSQLRRSASDTSLAAQRTLSRVSSLGDDSRFDHVQEQVNSRLQAIKDSYRDSNIRLPSLPSMSNFRPDFFRERSGSYGRKDSVGDREKPEDPMTRQPYHSAKAAVADAGPTRSATHPHLNRALDQLEGDVVVLGGYRGSILRTAEPPHRQLWVPIKVGLNLRKADLEVGLSAEDDERDPENIIPGGMLNHIGPVDISRRLFKRLRACENARQGRLEVHDYGYDWRLNPLFLSRQLIKLLEGLACNQPGVSKEKRGAMVIAHSLGGLITRHAVNQRPELFRGVVYAGVPHTCVNILGPLRNGDEVLLSSRVLTAQVNFTIRTTFALLPLDGRCFFDKHTKEEYVVDFFDPQTWIDYRLSPCIARPLPPLTVQEKPSGIAGYVSSMTSALPSLPIPGRKGSVGRSKDPADASKAATAAGAVAEPDSMGAESGKAMTEGNIADSRMGRDSGVDLSNSPRTTVTIPRQEAIAYLTRTLANVKKFKQELAANPAHTAKNRYPPVAVIYGKSTPTVYGARVNGREGIKHADAYDELAFASGDGVVLARAAMVPEGYTAARGGIISSERGHVTLLGDLEAVGKCLNAVIGARKRGVGYGA